MTSALKAVLDYVAPLPLVNTRDQLLEKFVHNTISDIALLSLSTGLACYFSISNDLRWAYIKQNITAGFSHLIHCTIATFCRYVAISEKALYFRTASFALDCIVSHSFMSTFGVFQLIFHESGHAVSSYLLYKNCTVQVVTVSLTEWNTITRGRGELSKLGSYLGERYSNLVRAAMGPLTDVATSQISLIGALILKNSYPQLSKNLFLYMLSTSQNCMEYASIALDPANASPHNDYVTLWKEGGIHPYLAIIGMVAMPLITTLGYLVLRRQS